MSCEISTLSCQCFQVSATLLSTASNTLVLVSFALFTSVLIVEIPQPEQTAWTELNSVMDSEGGFANYRKVLARAVSPCIPYVYVALLFFHSSYF